MKIKWLHQCSVLNSCFLTLWLLACPFPSLHLGFFICPMNLTLCKIRRKGRNTLGLVPDWQPAQPVVLQQLHKLRPDGEGRAEEAYSVTVTDAMHCQSQGATLTQPLSERPKALWKVYMVQTCSENPSITFWGGIQTPWTAKKNRCGLSLSSNHGPFIE